MPKLRKKTSYKANIHLASEAICAPIGLGELLACRMGRTEFLQFWAPMDFEASLKLRSSDGRSSGVSRELAAAILFTSSSSECSPLRRIWSRAVSDRPARS